MRLEDLVSSEAKRVRLPNGKDVDVKIPLGVAHGQQFRLRGMGEAGTHAAGDVKVTIEILPHAVSKSKGGFALRVRCAFGSRRKGRQSARAHFERASGVNHSGLDAIWQDVSFEG